MMAYYANGSEGSSLDNQCSNCRMGGEKENPCPIYHVQTVHNYDQVDNKNLKSAMSKLIDDTGECLARTCVNESSKALFLEPGSDDSKWLEAFKRFITQTNKEVDLEMQDDDIFGYPYFVDLNTRAMFEAFTFNLINRNYL